ncbi:MAG: HisS family protein [Candidatus Absconditabacterales bacterium]
MYRPGGFSEFAPEQQKVFDAILATLTRVFEQHNFEHIWTPAVESVDILKKGGDIIDKQVYGLFGLAQGVEDVKDYGLHFDLTIPLARYVLDHRNELSFPFRRYQMQPVWRGEKTKRGRFKEFWQFDIDAVWPSESNMGLRYDIEALAVLSKSMKAVCDTFHINIDSVLKISHIGLTKSFLSSNGLDEVAMSQVLGLLDDYFKVTHEEFEKKLQPLVSPELFATICTLIKTKDYALLSDYQGYEDLHTILSGLKALEVPFEYDICIVRGHGYYKGMVCERFDTQDISLGSLAGGGRYDNVTDFIDPKQSFSGVGASLGRFVYLAIDKIGALPLVDKYLFVNFADTRDDIIALYNQFIFDGKTCELYPMPAKIGKQFEYADKKSIRYAILYGDSEKQGGYYIQKDLISGQQEQISL